MSDTTLDPLASRTAPVVARLHRLRARIAAWFWVDGLSRVLWLARGLAAADLALDWLFRMDRAQRGVMLVLMLAVIGYVAWRRLVRPLSATPSDDALALQVEAANKELGQGLISALQLSRIEDAEARGMSPVLVRQTVEHGARAAEGLDFSRILDGREFRLSAVLLALALVLIGGVAYGAAATEGPLAIWFNRNILLGDARWPQKTYLLIERVGDDGRVVFPRGEDWTQLVSVTPESKVVPEQVWLDFRRTRSRAPLAMKRTGERQFEATFASVLEAFEFRARGGDAVTDWVRVELVDQPAVQELTLVVTPPAYTGQAAEELPPGRGPYYVLKGSRLALEGTANKPLARADLVIDGRRLPLALSSETAFFGQIEAADLTAGQYTLDLEDTLGLTSRRPTTFGLRQRIDREPRVRVRLIGISGMVVPQARVPFTCRITDDFGITAAHVAYRWKGDDATNPDGEGQLTFEQVDSQVGQASRLPELAFDDIIELAPLKVPTGTGLSFRFEAADNDDVSGPNVGRSSEFLLRIVTEEELRTDLLRREKEQRQEFERHLKQQEELLTDCRALEAAVKGQADLEPRHKDQLIQYHKRQKLIGQNVGAVAERMASIVIEVQNNRLEEDGGRLQTRLTRDIIEPMEQVAGEMVPEALAGLERTRRQATDAADRDAALAEAIAQQTQIAARMREILEHMVKAEGFQEAVNLLYEIQKIQADVHEQTNRERQERIRRILEGDDSRAP
jgi:hypothetical protein